MLGHQKIVDLKGGWEEDGRSSKIGKLSKNLDTKWRVP